MAVAEGTFFLTLAAATIGWALLGGVFIVWRYMYGPINDIIEAAWDILGPRRNRGGRPQGSSEGIAGLIQEWAPAIKAFAGSAKEGQTQPTYWSK